jgi:nitrate reductase gamma subunit
MIANFIDGYLWYFSLAVFVIGVTWKLLSLIFGKHKTDFSVAKGSSTLGAIRAIFSRFIPDKGMAPHIKVQVIAGYLFHLGLFALLFFAAPHVKFLDENFLGFSWTTLPHWGFIVAAQVAFLGLLLLFLFRLMYQVTRLISSTGDYLASIITFIVMLTGCLALLEEFNELRLLHRFSVEIFLIYFPFSSLMHAFTFIPSRAFTGAWFGRRGIKS